MEFLLRKLDSGGGVGVLLDSRGRKDAALSRDLVRVAKSFGIWVYLILEALARWRHVQEGRLQAREANSRGNCVVGDPRWIAWNFFPETHGQSVLNSLNQTSLTEAAQK